MTTVQKQRLTILRGDRILRDAGMKQDEIAELHLTRAHRLGAVARNTEDSRLKSNIGNEALEHGLRYEELHR